MATFEYRTRLNASAAEVFKWHTRAGAFERLSPPWQDIKVLDRKGGVLDGGEVTLRIGRGPAKFTWVLRHKDVQENRQFADEQVKGPMRRWHHVHRFEPAAGGGCTLVDHIDYALPLGGVGSALVGSRVRQMLERLFRYRQMQLEHDLTVHAKASDPRPHRVVVGGASGLIGTRLCNFLTTGGHHVDRLVRHMARPGGSDIYWNPAKSEIDRSALEGADVVVNLAGENLMGRWTPEKKKAILDSRVQSTRLLAETLAQLSRKPKVFVSVSATGYYGDRAGEVLTEQAAPGNNFLAEVCRAWEAAAEPAEAAGIRVVHPRIGMVLSGRGGALRAMLPAYQLGAGGPIGSGYQYVSWIDMDDLLGVLHLVMLEQNLDGPVNAVSPHTPINREFSRTLAMVLHRPMVLSVPGPLARKVMGEMADAVLLPSQRVVPQRLSEAGFAFRYAQLEDAIRHQLGRFQQSGKASRLESVAGVS